MIDMQTLNPRTMSERENYLFLTGSIIPRPIAFVTSISQDGTLNGAPFSYFNIVSAEPPLISLSVQHDQGKSKDTARNILEKKEFVIHIVDEANVEKINMTAARLQPHESEITLAGLTDIPSTIVTVPSVKEAKIRLECVLERSVSLESTDLLIGRVVQYHVDENIYSNGRIDAEKLAAVSRLAGSQYAKIGELFSLVRPK